MKRPAFQFYPQDWLSDFYVKSMTYEQKGIYIDLLCLMWTEESCSLPDDQESLEVILKVSSSTLATVLKRFIKKGGKIFHKRLLAERKKQDEWREKCRKGGLTSGKQRLKGSSTTVKRVVQVNANSSSSSSSFKKTTPKGVSKKDIQIKITPSQMARQFFNLPAPRQAAINKLMEASCPEDVATQEIHKFIEYWTEPNKSGTQQRWQLEKTFEIGRRLKTWFRNYKNFNPTFNSIVTITP